MRATVLEKFCFYKSHISSTIIFHVVLVTVIVHGVTVNILCYCGSPFSSNVTAAYFVTSSYGTEKLQSEDRRSTNRAKIKGVDTKFFFVFFTKHFRVSSSH